MSGDIKYPRAFMLECATKVHNHIQSYCELIKIAGSLRRGESMCGDIELVVLPKTYKENPLFGDPVLLSRLEGCNFESLGQIIKNGERFKQIMLNTDRGKIQCDIFVVMPPAQFGIIYCIRTGPAEFSSKIVRPKTSGGYLPANMYVKDGLLWKKDDKNAVDQYYITPDEKTFFHQISLKYIGPMDRK